MSDNINAAPEGAPSVVVTNAEANSHRITVQPNEAIRASTGVLATATTRSGGTISRAVEPGDLVSILNGTMQTTVQRALDLGYLAKDAQGRIVDVAQTPDARRASEAAEAAKQGPSMDHAMEASHETSHGLGYLTHAVQATNMHPVQALAAVASGDAGQMDKLVSALSVAHQASASEVRDFLMKTGAAFEADLAADLAKNVGVTDLAACWAYLRATVPTGTLNSAVSALVFRADARPMRELAGRFMSSGAAKRGDALRPVEVEIAGRRFTTTTATARRLRGSGLRIA